jgi:hypothetical protein
VVQHAAASVGWRSSRGAAGRSRHQSVSSDMGRAWEAGGSGAATGRLGSCWRGRPAPVSRFGESAARISCGQASEAGWSRLGRERFGVGGTPWFLCELKATAQLRWSPDGARIVVHEVRAPWQVCCHPSMMAGPENRRVAKASKGPGRSPNPPSRC